MTEEFIDTILRLGAAAAAGMILGLNRDMADKPIGMRTLGLVALGAAVVSLCHHPRRGHGRTSGCDEPRGARHHPGDHGRHQLYRCGRDPARLQSKTVEGLTTAATVWVTAALGIACGLAAWSVVGVAVVLALVLLVGIGWLEGIYSNAPSPSRTRR